MGTSVGVPLSGGTQAHAGSGTVHLDLQLRKHRGQPLMVLLCCLPTPSPMGRVPSQAAPPPQGSRAHRPHQHPVAAWRPSWLAASTHPSEQSRPFQRDLCPQPGVGGWARMAVRLGAHVVVVYPGLVSLLAGARRAGAGGAELWPERAHSARRRQVTCVTPWVPPLGRRPQGPSHTQHPSPLLILSFIN